MFKKIILSLLIATLLLSGVSGASTNNYDCGTIWNKYNWKQSITTDEVKVCYKKLVRFWKNEIKLEYTEYKENKNYCYDKWIETYMRRKTSRVEDKLCGKKFAQYNREVVQWKRTLVNY